MREAHVYSEIVPHDLSADELRTRRPAGIILSGGPSSVYEAGAPQVDPGLFSLGVPVLGICYGHQLMARALGGEVAATGQREYGGTTLTVDGGSKLLQDFPASDTVWMSHGDAVTREPEGFRVMARTDQIPIAAMEDPARGMYAVQFHPEVSHTSHGQDVMKRFLYEGCDLLPDWTPTNIIDDQVARIRSQVGQRAGAVRVERRRRFRGGGAAGAPRGGRPADVRVRRPRVEPRRASPIRWRRRSRGTSGSRWCT